ncbi:MAG: DEAD/DEAH box helicase [bacterium]
MDYRDFIVSKAQANNDSGFQVDAESLNPMLFDFQRETVAWACRKGRAAVFADCGLGKTPIQLSWAELVPGNVLVLTPLAVSYQTIREAEKFGIEAHRSGDGTIHPITITNYERLHYFSPSDFSAVVCDESSILKSFNGKYRQEITTFMRKLPYRLLCTATAAPNDYTELGTSSEALGYLGYMDMLNRFFKNDRNTSGLGRCYGKVMDWRLKGHAEIPFWRWVCSWALSFRRPSDLGFNDDDFILKPLIENIHVVETLKPPDGRLFTVDAFDLREQRDERKRSISERCEKVAELVDHDKPALVWCHLNDEGKMLKNIIPDAVEVSGADSDESKESKLLDFASGNIRVLITKPKIGGWGLNFQHCAHVVLFPSHSFEQYYQAIRRCWRFGQKDTVTVDVVTTSGERRVLENLQSKSRAADEMFSRLVEFMNESKSIRRDDDFTEKEVIPAWL